MDIRESQARKGVICVSPVFGNALRSVLWGMCPTILVQGKPKRASSAKPRDTVVGVTDSSSDQVLEVGPLSQDEVTTRGETVYMPLLSMEGKALKGGLASLRRSTTQGSVLAGGPKHGEPHDRLSDVISRRRSRGLRSDEAGRNCEVGHSRSCGKASDVRESLR